VRCSGWYVNENTDAAVRQVRALRQRKTEEYLAAMAQLGCRREEIMEQINQIKEDKHE
jgi:DNA-binding transcriptional regulator YhcF (GntR family)